MIVPQHNGGGMTDRPAMVSGNGVPSDSADVAMIYIQLDAATSDGVLHIWDPEAGSWSALNTQSLESH